MTKPKLMPHQAMRLKETYDAAAKDLRLLSRKERRQLAKGLDVKFTPIPEFQGHQDFRWRVKR